MKVFIRLLAFLIALLVAAFFLFVGYWKALGPIAALAEHHAWVAGFPAWFARVVGCSEILAALLLALTCLQHFVLQRFSRRLPWVLLYLFLNQGAAAATHLWRAELPMLIQNGVLCALFLSIYLCWKYITQADRFS